MRKFPMTKSGYEALKEKLRILQQVERPKVLSALAEARSHGDLSENAEYESAKEKQAYIDAKIREIEEKLANAEIIEIDKSKINTEQVAFGAFVSLKDINTAQVVSYLIVGEDEADYKNGSISINSPLARELIGCRKGDVIEIQTSKAIKEYEVIEISYDKI
ncbi:MAG: transcription elongation factor GreA [bacterium]